MKHDLLLKNKGWLYLFQSWAWGIAEMFVVPQKTSLSAIIKAGMIIQNEQLIRHILARSLFMEDLGFV